jgi:curved DNA-binding protein CbpA
VDYYELLRLDPLANAGIAAEAYLVMRNYYLRLIEQTGASRELVELLADGYELISDPAKRREYDRSRKVRTRAREGEAAVAAAEAAEGSGAGTKTRRTGAQRSIAKTAPAARKNRAAAPSKKSAPARAGTNGHGPDSAHPPKETPEVFEPISVKLVRSLAFGSATVLRLGSKHSISFARKASQTLRDVLVDDQEVPVSIIDLTPDEEEALLTRLSSFPDTVAPSETQPDASNSGALARLSILDGPGLGRAFEVDSIPFTLGEDDSCDITLPGLAAQQARLLHRNGQFVLFSLTDDPKTSIHGDSVAWAVLEDGDSFEVGPYVLKFESPSLGAPTH